MPELTSMSQNDSPSHLKNGKNCVLRNGDWRMYASEILEKKNEKFEFTVEFDR